MPRKKAKKALKDTSSDQSTLSPPPLSEREAFNLQRAVCRAEHNYRQAHPQPVPKRARKHRPSPVNYYCPVDDRAYRLPFKKGWLPPSLRAEKTKTMARGGAGAVTDLSELTINEISSGTWADACGSDETKHIRPHPVAVAIREQRAKLAEMGMPHGPPREYFGEKDAYWDFQRCVQFGLNPHDFDRVELDTLMAEAEKVRKAKEKAKDEHQAEELRRNPPPPPAPRVCYRVVELQPTPQEDACQRVPSLALHERYGKTWKPKRAKAENTPVLEKFYKPGC